MSKREPPVIDVKPARVRRRFPWGISGVLLALIGIGLYVAWPAIDSGFTQPAFNQPTKNANLAKPVDNAMDHVPFPPMDDGGALTPTDIPITDAASGSIQADADDEAREKPVAAESTAVEDVPFEDDLTALAARLEELEATTAVGGESGDRPSEGTLADLAVRIDALEKRSTIDAGISDDAENIMALGQRLDELEAAQTTQGSQNKLAAYREEAAATHLQVQALNKRVADLESQLQASATAAGRYVQQSVSAGRLIEAARSGQSYTVQLAALRESARGDAPVLAALDAMQEYARAGVPTEFQLRSIFPSVASDIARAVHAAHEDDWVSETVAELKRIVTIRRVRGDLPPDSVDARLMTAERALVAGDLHAAVTTLAPYGDVGGAPAADWLSGARMRLDVDQTIAQLETLLLKRAGAALNGVDE